MLIFEKIKNLMKKMLMVTQDAWQDTYIWYTNYNDINC